MKGFVVRNIVRGCIACVLALGPSVLLGGCATDSLGPGGGEAVWIGQSISGRAAHAVTGKGIEGVAVTFLAGLDADTLVPLGGATTSSTGSYSIVRAQQTGTAGDFWWFSASGEEPVTVHLALRASKAGYVPVEVTQRIQRMPSADPPSRLLENYQLQLSAALRQITGED